MLPGIFGENPFDDLFPDAAYRRFSGAGAKRLMRTDVCEKDGKLELSIDLPGFKKEDILLELCDGTLTVRAARSENADRKDGEGRYIRRERFCGVCSRSYYVGDVRPEEIDAAYTDGILRVTLPGRENAHAPQQNRIRIQ